MWLPSLPSTILTILIILIQEHGISFNLFMLSLISFIIYQYILFFLTLGLFIYLFIYLWLCWVFVSVRRLSLVAASGGHSSSRCAGLSLSRPLLLRSTGSRCTGSVTVAHGPSCSVAWGILPDQGSNPCPLHWQVDSQPLHHQGSPDQYILKWNKHFALLQVCVSEEYDYQ